MKSTIHAAAGLVGLAVVLTFFTASALAELSGDTASIAAVKRFILYGLGVLVPAMGAAAASGFGLAERRSGALVEGKKRRMRWIGMNGALILTPCAVVLDRLASQGDIGAWFAAVQAVEFVAGGTNVVLLGLMARDGFRLSGRLAAPTVGSPPGAASVPE